MPAEGALGFFVVGFGADLWGVVDVAAVDVRTGAFGVDRVVCSGAGRLGAGSASGGLGIETDGVIVGGVVDVGVDVGMVVGVALPVAGAETGSGGVGVPQPAAR